MKKDKVFSAVLFVASLIVLWSVWDAGPVLFFTGLLLVVASGVVFFFYLFAHPDDIFQDMLEKYYGIRRGKKFERER